MLSYGDGESVSQTEGIPHAQNITQWGTRGDRDHFFAKEVMEGGNNRACSVLQLK